MAAAGTDVDRVLACGAGDTDDPGYPRQVIVFRKQTRFGSFWQIVEAVGRQSVNLTGGPGFSDVVGNVVGLLDHVEQRQQIGQEIATALVIGDRFGDMPIFINTFNMGHVAATWLLNLCSINSIA